MNSVNIAIVGCGAAALRYYVPAFQKYRNDLGKIYLIDIDTENAGQIREALGRGEIRREYKDVLPDIDGAIILLPNHLHHGVAMECLNAGVNVLCEKPLAVLPEHARDMVEAAEKNHVSLCVNNTRRMFPNFRAVRNAIQSGELGRLLEVEYTEGSTFGWPSSTGFYVNPKVSSKGILLDLGSHVIDTLCWWLDGKPYLEEFQDDSYGGPESVVKIQAGNNGCRARITLNRLCELQNTFRVVGEKASIEGGIFTWKQVTLNRKPGSTEVKKLSCPARNYPGFVLPVVENFIQVIGGTQPPLVSGRDVLPSIEFIHECYERRRHFDFPWDRDVYLPPTVKKERGRAKHKRILVTGAAGFIGCRVVEMLHLAGKSDHQVVAAIRQWSSAARLGRLPVEIVTMDLMDRTQVDKALENITHVIHCAKGTPEVTVDGTMNLLDTSLEKGIQHLIHISTADVYGDAAGLVDERFPLQYTGNAYNRMKIDAEKVCEEYIKKGLPLTIFRPSIVYGPYSNNWCLRFASLMLAREWGIYETYGEGKCNLVYVDDLVRTLISALDNDAAFGRALNVNGPEIITWNEYFSRLNSAMGLPLLEHIHAKRADMRTYAMMPVRMLGGFVKKHFLKPVKLLAENSAIVDGILRNVERQVKNRPAADELKLYAKDVIYSNALARQLLSYSPDTNIDEGMKENIEWLIYLGKIQLMNK